MRTFQKRYSDFLAARKRNGWRPTPHEFKDIAKACVEHGHGGLWSMEYNVNDYVSLDMKHCYPASYKGQGDCKKYYDRYGHPDGQFFRVSLNGKIPDVNGFVKLTKWSLKRGLHPIIYAWYGKHIQENAWLPIPLLKFFEEQKILTYTTHEGILCHSQKTQWLPQDNHAASIVIGKFTQGAKNGEQHLQRRIVTDEEELNFLIKRAHDQGILVRAEKTELMHENTYLQPYWVLSYYHDNKAQYYHLREQQ